MAPKWTVADIPDLAGRTALVTGANSGLGFEIASILAEHGARVLLACRNQEKAGDAAARIRSAEPAGTVEVRPLDLASLQSIDALGDQIRSEEPTLDLLVNNAGLMGVDAGRTEDGFETQFGVNHLGHFALTIDLLPVLLATPGSRVVTMSSFGHRMGRMHFGDLMFDAKYDRWGAYFQSKLANLLFTAELQRRLGPEANTQAFTAHPGNARTDLGFEGSGASNWVMRTAARYAQQSARSGAMPAVRAATDPTAIGGEFYGPRFLYAGATPVRETPSRNARNAGDARLLWTMSEQLTGHSSDGVLPAP
jgi:NAD(P)-dependent dehydrogenase (short-subunit alcohol dehydrogenase family)